MSHKLRVGQDTQPVQKANGLEGTYKALASAKQQKLFSKVLNQAQNTGKDLSTKEDYSLTSGLPQMEQYKNLDLNGFDAEQAKTAARSTGKEHFNSLATSSLLSLTALTSGSSGLKNGYLKSMELSGATGYSPAGSTRSTQTAASSDSKEIGSLSAKFESGDNGIATIGYDERGGTSYGTYQIASRPGTMRAFIDYLQEKSPRMASRLRAAGPTNTGGRNGAMPKVWKQIASEDTERFAKLQRDFIEQTHYLPALDEIKQKTGVDLSTQPQAVKEALWSTAVQHGPKGASNIFCKAINRTTKSGQEVQAKNLIDSVYASRGKQFGTSTASTRNAVQGRFQEEKSIVLAMLNNQASRTEAEA